jgi:hypothetical protein
VVFLHDVARFLFTGLATKVSSVVFDTSFHAFRSAARQKKNKIEKPRAKQRLLYPGRICQHENH